MKKLVGLMCVITLLAACKKDGGDGGGGAGMGGAPMLTGACADVDVSAGGPALYAAAAAVLTPASPCGFSSCHNAQAKKAMLVLMDAPDIRALLVDKPSCEAPTVPLIDGKGNEAALNNSWLWLKLTAMTDGSGSGKIAPNPAWGMNGACGQDGDKPFGIRMPWTNSDMMLDPTKVPPLKAWICAGAPGPQ